jgi:hypothetical protein
MGGLGLGIDLTRAPADGAALDTLHHQVWDIVANRIARLVEGWPASEEIAANYLYFEEYDGSWFATKAELFYSFGDAAVRGDLRVVAAPSGRPNRRGREGVRASRCRPR